MGVADAADVLQLTDTIMTKKSIFLLSLLCACTLLNAQEFVNELNGFRLGQFRKTSENEFGAVLEKGKFDDGYEYQAHIVSPDSTAYMIFEYAPEDTAVIWSIQFTGTNSEMDPGFKGLKLGMPASEVKRIAGRPGSKESAGEYGDRWEYEHTNFSFEIDLDGRLSSIKIMNVYPKENTKVPDLPSFENTLHALTSGDNETMMEALAPGIEIYTDNQTLFFTRSARHERSTDASGIFKTVRELMNGLDQVDINDQEQFSMDMRVALGQDPMWVFKILKGHRVKEIVMKNINGKFLVWEISA